MSQARFAPITASLLARKGNAMPSSMMPAAIMPPFVPAAIERFAPPPRTSMHVEQELDHEVPHDPTRPKKLFIALSHREHERLAIAAVKTGLNRHQLVRDALEAYFEQLSRDMQEGCACMSGAKSCSGSCDS
ncbi:MAG TPA: CopG family transcriptional regulator [Rhizomicrobium sp.]|nr:CopG family transcriptional regulator [Rhizomicrobium sp.]